MIHKKEKLFYLIKRLESSEKKFLSEKLKASGEEYLYVFYKKLLRQIKTEKNYNEKKLENYLQRKFPQTRKKFGKQKFLLYEKILEYLYLLHTQYIGALQLKLGKIQVLIQKGFWEEAEQRLTKLENILREEENLELLLQCYNLYFDLYNRFPLKQVTEKYFLNFQKQQYLLSAMKKQWKYNEFILELHKIRNFIDLETEKQNALNKLFKEFQHFFSELSDFKTLQILHYEFLSFFHFIKQDYTTSWQYGKKIIDVFKENPPVLKQRPNSFVSNMNNLIYVALMENNWKKIFRMLEELRIFLRKLPMSYKTDLIEFLLLCELMHLYSSQDKSLTKKNLPELLKLYKQYEETVSLANKPWIIWGFSIVYYQLKDYDKAVFWIHQILNAPQETLIDAHYSFMFMMLLVFHYESGNKEILPSLFRRFYRYLQKKNFLHPLEKSVMNFFREVLKNSRKFSEKELLIRFKKELEAHPDVAAYNRDIFDFLKWTERQIQAL